jgi:predicted DNA-binding transcriptional regulator AlpA
MDELFTDRELAEKLKRPPNWLAKLRCRGEGPKFIKLGGAIRYRRRDVDAWLDELTRRSTSDRV